MQGTGPHHRPCGCISQARTKQGKYTPGDLTDTHCSLALRTGLFSTLYSLSTSCCYREDPTREWKEELEKPKHDINTGNKGMFNPRSQPSHSSLLSMEKPNAKLNPSIIISPLMTWPGELTSCQGHDLQNWLCSPTEKILKEEKRAGIPPRKGLYLQDGDISNSIQRAHEIRLNEQILLSRKLKERKYD